MFIPAQQVTLAWTHSIEKQRWEEDYAVQPGATAEAPPVLQALAARVRGSAAGMEPRPMHGWSMAGTGTSRWNASPPCCA